MLKLVHDATANVVDDPEAMTIGLDELCRVAAQDMLAVALAAERRAYLEAHAQELDDSGHRLVVGNGFARAREVTTGAGMIEVSTPAGRRPPRGRALQLGPSCRPTCASPPR